MATKKQLLEQSQKAIGEYFELSAYLFGEFGPDLANEIPKDNKFYAAAKDWAEYLEIDWERMTREQSRQLILNLLAEHYDKIQPDEKYDPVLTITFRKGRE